LETQHLAVFWSEKRTQNEPDFECKKRLSKRKSRFRAPGSRCQGLNQDSGFGIQEVKEQVPGGGFQVAGARSAVAWEYYAARLPAGYCPPEPALENVSRGTKSPQRGRLHSESSGSLGRGCYFSTLDFRLLDFEKLNDRRGNVYENKGPLKCWKKAEEGRYILAGLLLVRGGTASGVGPVGIPANRLQEAGEAGDEC
jgi:hypothetical protein